MKKLFLSVITAMTFFAASAQGWYIGPQASLNISSISGTTDGKSKAGFSLGAFGGYDLNDWFGAEAQVLVSSQGVKGVDDVTLTSFQIKNTYITIPVLAKFSIRDNIFFLAGPQFGFNLASKYKDTAISWTSVKENCKGFDFGVLIGAGYQFDFGLRAGISYSMGVSEVFKTNPSSNHNRVFAISAGWRF